MTCEELASATQRHKLATGRLVRKSSTSRTREASDELQNAGASNENNTRFAKTECNETASESLKDAAKEEQTEREQTERGELRAVQASGNEKRAASDESNRPRSSRG